MKKFEVFREVEGIRNVPLKKNVIFSYLAPNDEGSLFQLKPIQRFCKQSRITKNAKI